MHKSSGQRSLLSVRHATSSVMLFGPREGVTKSPPSSAYIYIFIYRGFGGAWRKRRRRWGEKKSGGVEINWFLTHRPSAGSRWRLRGYRRRSPAEATDGKKERQMRKDEREKEREKQSEPGGYKKLNTCLYNATLVMSGLAVCFLPRRSMSKWAANTVWSLLRASAVCIPARFFQTSWAWKL